jgi:hypothetical protein
MAYASLMAHCHQCSQLFTANPNRVPSLRLPDGAQVVFCRTCVEAANPRRIAAGLQPIPTIGAYEPEECA